VVGLVDGVDVGDGLVEELRAVVEEDGLMEDLALGKCDGVGGLRGRERGEVDDVVGDGKESVGEVSVEVCVEEEGGLMENQMKKKQMKKKQTKKKKETS
jgi:hypothetical protein